MIPYLGNLKKHFGELADVLLRTFVSMIPIIVFAEVDNAIKTMYVFYLMMMISYVLKKDVPLRYKISLAPVILTSVIVVASKSWGVLSISISEYSAKLLLVSIVVGLPLFLCIFSDTGHELAMSFLYTTLAYLTLIVIYPEVLGIEKVTRFIAFLQHIVLITILLIILYCVSMLIRKYAK